MRLLAAIRTLNPIDGGPVEGFRNIVKFLAAQGINVDMLSADSPHDSWVKGWPGRVIAAGPSPIQYGLSLRVALRAFQLAKHYDVLVLSGMWQFPFLCAGYAALWHRKPYYCFIHGMLDPYRKRAYPIKHVKKWLYWPWGVFPILRLAEKVFFTSEEERKLAPQSFWLYKCSEEVVGYGVSEPPNPTDAEISTFAKRFPELCNRRYLVYLGRLDPVKGVDILLSAYLRIVEQDQDLYLALIGPDSHGIKKELEQTAKQSLFADRVLFPGVVTGMDKWLALSKAEAFTIASHQENFGVAIAEALASRVPVLITNKVNIWQEISAEDAGYISDDSVESFEVILRRWIALAPEEKRAMKERARTCFKRHFNGEPFTANLLRVLEKHGALTNLDG